MYTEDDNNYRKNRYDTNNKSVIKNNHSDYYHDYYNSEIKQINNDNKQGNDYNILKNFIYKMRNLFNKSNEVVVNNNHKKHIIMIIILTIILLVLLIVLIKTVFIKQSLTNEKTNFIRIADENITLKVGEKRKLDLILSSSNSDYHIEWFSNNDNIVSIDDNGNILALKEGEAIILVTYYVDNKVYDDQSVVKVLK